MAVRGCAEQAPRGLNRNVTPVRRLYWYPYDPASRVAISSGSIVSNEASPHFHLSRGHSGRRPHAAARSRGVLLGRLAEVFRRTARRRDVARRGDAGTRGRGSGARPRVPAFSPRLALPDLGRLRGGGVRGLRSRPRPGEAAGAAAALPQGAPRSARSCTWMTWTRRFDGKPDARDETGDGDLHARDVTLQKNEKTRHERGARGERRRARGYRRETIRNAAFVRHRRHTRYTRCLEE